MNKILKHSGIVFVMALNVFVALVALNISYNINMTEKGEYIKQLNDANEDIFALKAALAVCND